MNFDTLIQGGMVIDGSGSRPAYKADVGITAGRIQAIGDLAGATAQQHIDAQGLVVSPGFIDSHSHDDWMVLLDPAMDMKVSQGVTTVVTGNCGISLFPLLAEDPPAPLNLLKGGYNFASVADYKQALEANPPSINVAALVGHSALRARFMPDLDRPANEAEIAQMQAAVEQALREGAIGVSTGTFYPPASAAPEAEVIRVCEPLKRLGGVYATHMRDEGDRVIEALHETWRIAQALEVPCVISHHKLVGKHNHGRSRETLALIDTFVEQSDDVCLDCYPYTASSTMLRPERTAFCDRILITWSEPHPEMVGRYVEDIAQEWGCSTYDAVERMVPGGAVYFIMDEQDVSNILAYKKTMVGSDGIPHDVTPHPRLWGSFTRVLGHYAREQKLFPLEVAVHKMTGLTATEFGLTDRGHIAEGMVADITIFNPDTVCDKADFHAPIQASEGIEYVMVQGELLMKKGQRTPARPGTMLSTSHQKLS